MEISEIFLTASASVGQPLLSVRSPFSGEEYRRVFKRGASAACLQNGTD